MFYMNKSQKTGFQWLQRMVETLKESSSKATDAYGILMRKTQRDMKGFLTVAVVLTMTSPNFYFCCMNEGRTRFRFKQELSCTATLGSEIFRPRSMSAQQRTRWEVPVQAEF